MKNISNSGRTVQFSQWCMSFQLLTFHFLICLNLVETMIRLEKASNQRQEFTLAYVYCSLYLMQCKTCPNICKGWSLTVDPLCGKSYCSMEWKISFSSRSLKNRIIESGMQRWKYRQLEVQRQCTEQRLIQKNANLPVV